MADSLVLAFEGANGSTTIVDSSPNPKTITAVGNAQISTTHSKYGVSSLYLDGSSRATIPANAELAMGTGDFTAEAWVYLTALPAQSALFGDIVWTAGYVGGWCVAVTSTGVLQIVYNGTSGAWTTLDSSVSAFTANAWHHVATSRQSGVQSLYLNGVQVATVANTKDYTTGRVFRIGEKYVDGTGANRMTGYIDDLRVTKGLARYTANFTPPTALVDQFVFGYAFTLFPGRAEALSLAYAGHKYGDATTWSFSCDDLPSQAFGIEDSDSPFFAPSGAVPFIFGVANSTTTSRFGGVSWFFPEVAAYQYQMVFPTGAGTIAAYTNFSFEFWVNVPAGGWPQVFAGTGWPTITLTPVANTWHHFAFCRKANILRAFSNGVKIFEALSTGAMSVDGFGYALLTNSGHAAFYLDSIGFSNNYAHYDGADFTPQNVPFYNVPTSVGARLEIAYSVISGEAYGTRITPTEADGQWSKTVLLIQGRGPVGSKAIVDAKGRTLFNQADVAYSDATSRNGSTSLYFNGTSAKLAIEPSRNLDLIDGDFTIEMLSLIHI